MKKVLLVAVIAIFSCVFSEKAQAQSFAKGQKNFNVGAGVGYGLGASASVDIGVSDLLSAGVIGVFSSYNYGYGFGSNFRIRYVSIGGRVAAHVGKYLKEIGINEEKLDPYIGAVGGVRLAKYNSTYSIYYDGASVYPMVGGFVGARYYFKEKMAVYAEGGFPYSNVGISIKF